MPAKQKPYSVTTSIYNTDKASFDEFLEKSGEIGYVSEVFTSIAYVSGIPSAHLSELVIFESGELGQIFSLETNYAEVLLFSTTSIHAGTRLTRTGTLLEIPLGAQMIGRTLDPLGRAYQGKIDFSYVTEYRPVDQAPSGFEDRAEVKEAFETGTSIIDLVVPLGKGQRELVIGDRKSGKTTFLTQTMLAQSMKNTICIYAAIAKRRTDIVQIEQFLKTTGIDKRCIVVASTSFDPPGLIYLTPYTAMTIAEFYRDLGYETFVILDDLTAHAKFYREINLLGRRFPGRNSYPGDIFYIHAKLLERAGKFKKASITALAVADTIMSDLTGYIQTNLMAITDGHIFFDTELFNAGRRPAVNPYLSVTRVGEQAQTPLVRDLSRELSRFLVHYQRLTQLSHFGAEFDQRVKEDMALGDMIFAFFNQPPNTVVPLSVSVLVLAGLWSSIWKGARIEEFKNDITTILQAYNNNREYHTLIEGTVTRATSLVSLIGAIKSNAAMLLKANA